MKTKKIVMLGVTAWLALAATTQSFGALTNGLAAYWPFDNITGCNNQTPDLVHGYTMKVIYGGGDASGPFLTNFNSNIYLTNGVHGNAVYVNNTGVANQMALAFISVNTNDAAPVNRSSPSSNTVSFWMKTDGNHPSPNGDMRIWTESDYVKTLASVQNFSAVGAGYDMFTRQNGTVGADAHTYGNFSGGVHNSGGGGVGSTVADGTWHNVTIITTPNTNLTSLGTNLEANFTIYVDGVLDTTFAGSGALAKSGGLWKLDTVGIFALVRNGNAGFVTNCVVDDLAEWTRVLDPTEIADFMANGITNAGSAVSPVSISQFASDLYAVVQGSQVQLSWQCSSDATGISIDNGVGNVLPLTTCGVGSTTITVNGNTTYTLTVTRGASSATKTVSITTVTGVAQNWNYVGGFNDLTAGNNLANQGNWQSLFSSPQTQVYTPAVVQNTVTGNHVLAMAGTPILSAGFFGSHSIAATTTNTLFFRFALDSKINDPLSTNPSDPNFGVIPDVDVGVGVSELTLFDVVSFSGTDKGPSIRIFRNAFGAGGPIDLTANIGASSTSGFSWLTSVDANGLQTGVVYNVWIDVNNVTNDANANVSQYYSVRVQTGGDSGPVTNLFVNQPSDETSQHNETLDKCFIAVNKVVTPQGTNVVLLDDFYVSSGGATHTLPVPAGSFVLGTPAVPTSISLVSVSKSGSSVTLNWTPAPAGSYPFTVQRRASLTSGSWSTIATGVTANTFTDTGATGDVNFYRVVSP